MSGCQCKMFSFPLTSMILVLVMMISITGGDSIMERLAIHEHFSQFARLVHVTPGVHNTYLDNYVTVFAPTNDALDRYEGDLNEEFILNHFVSTSIGPEKIGNRLTSLTHGNPPLWVRKIGRNLFVNQARVIRNISLVTDDGKKQYLYLIDSVLKFLVPNVSNNEVNDRMDSGHLVEHLQNYGVGNYSVKVFSDKMESVGDFGKLGKFTIFIPVDTAFKNLQSLLLDEEVVRAHMVPGHVMFTRPRRHRQEPVETCQHQSKMSLSVVAKMIGEAEDSVVQSITLVGNTRHSRGVVSARVILGDIVTSHGVIHLIDTPLVIRTDTMAKTLSSAEHNHRYKSFFSHLQSYPDLLETVDKLSNVTILVPTNEAFDSVKEDVTDEILSLHFMKNLVLESQIIFRTISDPFVSGESMPYYFWRGSPDDDNGYYVEVDGSRAKVLDIKMSSNGIIMSIDTVLGLPYQTVGQKVKKILFASKSSKVGKQKNFNDWLQTNETSFTYFVPTDSAWTQVKYDNPAMYKKLTQGSNPYQTEHLLERHLIAGRKMSIADLLSDHKVAVKRGSDVTITNFKEDNVSRTIISYDSYGIAARVVQADIKCTNGYIHLIDSVFIKRQDVTLGAAVRTSTVSLYLVITIIAILYLIKTIPFIKLVK